MVCRFCLMCVLFLWSTAAFAQPLGTFRWQLQPFCNVLTLAVTRSGGVFRLESTDTQCGSGSGAKPVQYGLIAEEVVDVMPELVVRDATGKPETVAYHVLPTLLVAEVQRLERERVVLATQIDELTREIAALREATGVKR